jgi:prepilin-type N-terminal cleavage/methylation domain-containing protein
MIRPTRKQHGFTLVEMMVAMAAFGVALSAAMYIVIGVSSSAGRVRTVGDTQETARTALDALAAEIRMSGAGASSGRIGIGTTAPAVTRVPTIYSGPDITVSTAGGQQVVTSSIFIISSEPGAGAPSSDGTGMLGSVISAGVDRDTGIQVACTNQRAVPANCTDKTTFQDNAILAPLKGGGYPPLLVGDYVNAVYMRPTQVGSLSGNSQQLQFAEMAIPGAYSPDPKAPFGFAKGASLGKARITHWYLKQVSPGDWELVRSHPILDDTWSLLGGGCNPASPFIDETNSTALADKCKAGAGADYCGQIVGSGPVENLQIRYVVDIGAQDNPANFTVWGNGTNGGSSYHVGICDFTAFNEPIQRVLREVRVSVVARSRMADHANNGTTHVKRYGINAWEGVAPTGGGLDEYPRRTFEASVVPRNLQGILRL